MPDFLDIRVTELLCSRLCHELASPVGAINNGIEMIEEFDETMLPEAMPLIGSSARLVAARLKFYRMAYGMAGTRSLASHSEVRDLAEAFLSDGRSSLKWPNDSALPEWWDGCGKLLLNLLPLAAETLPRGGVIGVSFAGSEDNLSISVIAEGQGARIPEDCQAALAPEASVDELTPRSVHSYFLAHLARRMGSAVQFDRQIEDSITLTVSVAR